MCTWGGFWPQNLPSPHIARELQTLRQLAEALTELNGHGAPAALPIAVRTSAFTGSLCVPSPSAMNELSNG